MNIIKKNIDKKKGENNEYRKNKRPYKIFKRG